MESTPKDLNPRKVVEAQLDLMGWKHEDASADVDGAAWALRVTHGPPVKLHVAQLDDGVTLVVQSRVTVSPVHRVAFKRMKPRDRRRLATRLQLTHLSEPTVDVRTSSRDGELPDAFEFQAVIFQDELAPAKVRHALAVVNRASIKSIILVQDGAYGLEEHDVQQISVDPEVATGSYDAWASNLIVVTGETRQGLERLQSQWGSADLGQVVERLLRDNASKSSA